MSENGLKIGLIQFHRRRFEQNENLERAFKTLESVEGADIVSFPEVWMGAVVHEEPELDSLLAELAGFAKHKGFMLITGGLFVRRGEAVMDVCHVIGADGRIVCEQQKIFPSAAIGERAFCSGGGGMSVFECAGMKCGVLICVDMIYPELARKLALSGAQTIFNPANIPEQRNDLWHSLTRARAAENTVFVAYVNNTNTQYRDGRRVMGASLVAGPTGDIIAAAGDEASILYATLNPWRIEDQRSRWPYLDDINRLNGPDGPCLNVREAASEIEGI
ncbi:MAG: carbon-nitrogen hydrolase family protein [bacterium]